MSARTEAKEKDFARRVAPQLRDLKLSGARGAMGAGSACHPAILEALRANAERKARHFMNRPGVGLNPVLPQNFKIDFVRRGPERGSGSAAYTHLPAPDR